MARVAVVIGVDEVAGAAALLPLKRAASDARQVAEWLAGEGFEVLPFIDRDAAGVRKDVRLADIGDALEGRLHDGDVVQVVVFFAGHGYFKGTDLWLLSKAATRGSEAINLGQSLANALMSRVPHVVFIADACRALPGSVDALAIEGGSLFPNARRSNAAPSEVDQFLAVTPGITAPETGQPDSAFGGLFTDAFRRCFVDPPADGRLKVDGGGGPFEVVPNRKLRRLLPEKVIDVYGDRRIFEVRTPYINVPSADDAWVARVETTAAAAAPARPFSGADAGFVLPPQADAAETAGAEAGDTVAEPAPAPADPAPVATMAVDETARRLKAVPRSDRARMQVFETSHVARQYRKPGLLVTGARIAWLRRFDGRAGVTGPRDNPWVGFESIGQPLSVAIGFDSGSAALVSVFPRHVTRVEVDQRTGHVAWIAFRPVNPESGPPPEWLLHEWALARAYHEEATALMASGRLVLDRQDSAKLANRIRQFKAADPSLGIMAAYAYHDAGRFRQVSSLLRFMRRDTDGFVPFDVAMLDLVGRKPRGTLPPVVPFAPMMTRGLSLAPLSGLGDGIGPVAVSALRPHALNSLWTTYGPDGGELLRTARV